MSQHHARLSGWKLQQFRRQVLTISDVCWLCGHPGADTADHIIPVSQGGNPYAVGNGRPAHSKCNQQRGNKPPQFTRTSRRW